MKKIKHIRYWLAVHTPIKLLSRDERHRLRMARFRASALLFGCNTYHLSNEELLERVEELSKVTTNSGISIQEFSRVIAIMRGI